MIKKEICLKKLAILIPVVFSIISCAGCKLKQNGTGEEYVTVTFRYNFSEEETNVNHGLYSSGNDLSFKIDSIVKGSKISKPDFDPIRKGYDFSGWSIKAVERSLFDFNKRVRSNLNLYAYWTPINEETFIESEYEVPSPIDNSISECLEINGVLNMPIVDEKVELSKSAISRLIINKDDVKSCLNYKVKETAIFNAFYDEKEKLISYEAIDGTDAKSGSISVIDKTSNLRLSDPTQESVAKRHEDRAGSILDHRIVLAGSSTMEYWSTSCEDLEPLITYNQGIAGTSVQMWRDSLNQRIVYPFSPKAVCYYIGVNNIVNMSESVETTVSALLEMFDDVHLRLPNTKIYWILINILPGFPSKISLINEVNSAIKEYEKTHSYLKTIDAGKTLLNIDGEPIRAFFKPDGIHLAPYGYALWGRPVRETLIKDFKKDNK